MNRPVSLATLTSLEWRRLFDTRAGRAIALVGALAIIGGPVLLASTRTDRYADFAYQLQATTLPVGLVAVLLVVGSAASDYTYRTAWTTFVLTPDRVRVVAAQILAGTIATVALSGLAVGAAASGAWLSGLTSGATPVWDAAASDVVLPGLLALAGVWTALGLVHLARGSIVPLVVYLGLPAVVVLAFQFDPLREAASWIALLVALPAAFSGTDGALPRLAVALALTVVAPVVAGTVRACGDIA